MIIGRQKDELKIKIIIFFLCPISGRVMSYALPYEETLPRRRNYARDFRSASKS